MSDVVLDHVVVLTYKHMMVGGDVRCVVWKDV